VVRRPWCTAEAINGLISRHARCPSRVLLASNTTSLREREGVFAA
jgi:hypothetical protein